MTVSYDNYPDDSLPLDGSKAMKGDLDMGGHSITNQSGGGGGATQPVTLDDETITIPGSRKAC